MHKLTRTRLTLAKRTATLRTLVSQNASQYHLLKAAERVREARIQVLRATIGTIPFVTRLYERTEQMVQLDEQIAALRATVPGAILAEFQ